VGGELTQRERKGFEKQSASVDGCPYSY
jgi:hypothetical protein